MSRNLHKNIYSVLLFDGSLLLLCVCSASFPALVVKASGLAAGKGVIVAANQDEACAAVMDIMKVLEYYYYFKMS